MAVHDATETSARKQRAIRNRNFMAEERRDWHRRPGVLVRPPDGDDRWPGSLVVKLGTYTSRVHGP